MLPLCGVAVRSSRLRVRSRSSSPSWNRRVSVHLVAVEAGRHLVGLVDDDEVPVGDAELGLELLAAGELVEAGDEEVALLERVAGAGGLDHVAAEDVEVEARTCRRSSSCHCSTRLPGAMTRQRSRSPRSISSRM